MFQQGSVSKLGDNVLAYSASIQLRLQIAQVRVAELAICFSADATD